MIKKKLGLFIAPALMLGLAACNNDSDTAFDNTNGNRINPTTNVDNDLYRVNNRYPFDHQGPLAEDYNKDNGRNGRQIHEGRMNRNGQKNGNDNRARLMRNTNNNGGENVNARNNRYPFDHQGPLTEDYDNNRNDRNNGDRTTLRNRTQNNMNVTNRGNNNGNMNVTNRRNNGSTMNVRNDGNMNISNYSTDKNSTNYPHTRAVLIQEARYQYVPINPNLDSEQQAKLRQAYELAQSPELKQQLLKQAQELAQQQLRGQQPQAQAPAPQQQPRGQQPQAQAPAPQQQPQTQKQPAQAPQQQTKAPANVSQAVQQVIDLTNQQRKQNGLPPLQADTKLNSVAQKKSEDMRQNGYFSHTSPTYGSPFDMMRDFGVSYQSAAENIAQGQRTPQEVVQAWMNSQGHRENILGNYTHIGVGYDPAGHHWTQMFIRK